MNWLAQLFSRRRRYDELSESIREHLDEKIADLMDRAYRAMFGAASGSGAWRGIKGNAHCHASECVRAR